MSLLILSRTPFSSNQKLIVGVSGGSDSLGLLFLLLDQLPMADHRLVVAHVNYGLRGKASDQDEILVRGICRENRLPFERLRVKRSGRSSAKFSQDRGREIRYSFFHRLARKYKAWGVAVAHHQEDQAETILDRLLRGAGPKGLSGLRAVQTLKMGTTSLRIWRPLLALSKSEIQGFLNDRGILWREDASNGTNRYRRNQIRNQILPFLKKWNPRLNEALAHIGDITATEDQFLESFLDSLEKKIKSRWEDKKFSCDPVTFGKLPLALQRRWVRRVVEQLTGRPCGLSFERIEEVLHLWEGSEKGPRDLGFGLVAGGKTNRVFLLLKGLKTSSPL